MKPEQKLAETVAIAIRDISTAISHLIEAKTVSGFSNRAHDKTPAGPTEPSNPEPEPDLMTKRDVAKFMNVSLRTVDNWVRRRLLPHYRIGRVVRFKRGDILERLNSSHRLIGRRAR